MPGSNLFVSPFRSSALTSSGTAEAQEQLPTLESEAPSSEGREEGKELNSTAIQLHLQGALEARRTNWEGLVRARVPALTFKGVFEQTSKAERAQI